MNLPWNDLSYLEVLDRTGKVGPAARAPFHALVELCAAGMGLGLMPRAIAARHPHLVELREFAPKLGALERTAWLLCHPDQRRTARVVALMNAVAGAFT